LSEQAQTSTLACLEAILSVRWSKASTGVMLRWSFRIYSLSCLRRFPDLWSEYCISPTSHLQEADERLRNDHHILVRLNVHSYSPEPALRLSFQATSTYAGTCKMYWKSSWYILAEAQEAFHCAMSVRRYSFYSGMWKTLYILVKLAIAELDSVHLLSKLLMLDDVRNTCHSPRFDRAPRGRILSRDMHESG